MGKRPLWLTGMLLVACGSCGFGCAQTPYRCGRFPDSAACDQAAPKFVVEHGRPNQTLDRLAWVACLPTRILPMSPKVNNHAFSEETSEKLLAYLRDNDLGDVLVRVNQYDPVGEWRRLRQNTRLAAGWRYTFGTLGLVGYTILPGRVFGGDMYNPFTNTLYVNSDVPALLMTEAAYAKDVHARRFPGTYSAINELPVLVLWRYSIAVNDVLGYAQLHDDWEVERETYRLVYPLLGIQVALGGHSAASKLTALPLLVLPITAIGGAVAGHTIGQTTIAARERERAAHSDFDSIPPSPETELAAPDLEEPGFFHLARFPEEPARELHREKSGIQLTGAVESPEMAKLR